MTLILTGMGLFYSDISWAPVVMKAFGGPQVTGLIHRISAAIMLGIFFLHLIGVAINLYRNRKTFRWFGPDSLVPNWKDLKNAVGMFKWFVGKGRQADLRPLDLLGEIRLLGGVLGHGHRSAAAA